MVFGRIRNRLHHQPAASPKPWATRIHAPDDIRASLLDAARKAASRAIG